MISWKPFPHLTLSFLAASAAGVLILPAVSAQNAQEYGANNGQQSFSNAAEAPSQASENYESAYEPRPFSAPSSGFSAPYGYQGAPPSAYQQSSGFSRPSSAFSSGSLPSWQNNNSYGQNNYSSAQGILSSRIQTPVLPEGLVLPFQLDSTIDIDKAQPGDYVQGHITQNISAGGAAYLPGGSIVNGTIEKDDRKDKDGGHFKHAGSLSINFMQLRLPNGRLIRMNGHLVGRIGNYEFRDSTSGANKALNTAWRSGVGSELSWGAGTSFASLAGGSHAGPGGGSYAGALMGGATGLLETFFYRRGHDTYLHNGTRMELQLDAPLQVPGLMENHERYLPGTGRNTGMF